MTGLLLALLLAMWSPQLSNADAKAVCQTKKCELRVSKRKCDQPPRQASYTQRKRDVLPCIRRASLLHKVPTATLVAVVKCESEPDFDPYSYNPSGATGLMQFLLGTWVSTPYGRYSRTSAKWNPIAGAWLIQTDGLHHWNASRFCWG